MNIYTYSLLLSWQFHSRKLLPILKYWIYLCLVGFWIEVLQSQHFCWLIDTYCCIVSIKGNWFSIYTFLIQWHWLTVSSPVILTGCSSLSLPAHRNTGLFCSLLPVSYFKQQMSTNQHKNINNWALNRPWRTWMFTVMRAEIRKQNFPQKHRQGCFWCFMKLTSKEFINREEQWQAVVSLCSHILTK